MIPSPSPDTAVVTGGGGPLGRAIALELARASYRRIAIVELNEPAARATAAAVEGEIPGTETLCVTGDVTDPATPAAVIAAVTADGRRLSSIVNNAAVSRSGRAETVTREDWDLMMRVNLAGPMFLCQAAVPHWRTHGVGASVVNISSRA